MVNTSTLIHYDFPCFGLEVTHDALALTHAKFVSVRGNTAILAGEVSDLTEKILLELDSYKADPKFRFNLPLRYSGSDHQLKVWKLMQNIQSGEVLSYGEAAKLIRSAPRAVGGACGKNPLPVFIPCHRIIAAKGRLGGFNSGNIYFGLEIKKWLLEHEGVGCCASGKALLDGTFEARIIFP